VVRRADDCAVQSLIVSPFILPVLCCNASGSCSPFTRGNKKQRSAKKLEFGILTYKSVTKSESCEHAQVFFSLLPAR